MHKGVHDDTHELLVACEVSVILLPKILMIKNTIAFYCSMNGS